MFPQFPLTTHCKSQKLDIRRSSVSRNSYSQGQGELLTWHRTNVAGYGTPSPRTTGGRVFVVILYIVGIPFTILAVLDAGKLFFMLERFVFRNTVYLCKRSFYGCKSFYNKLRPIVKPNRVEDFEVRAKNGNIDVGGQSIPTKILG